MKASMEFVNPRYLTDAFEILDQRGKDLKICGGMTHLLRFYSDFPNGLGDCKGILHVGNLEALRESREEYQRYVIGATARITDLEKDEYLWRYAPALVTAAQSTSTPQIRNRRTVGGEICWGAYHSPLIVTLAALNAQVRVRFRGENGQAGREEVLSLDDFFDGEKKRVSSDGRTLVCRNPKTQSENLLLKVVLPEESLKRSGTLSFFRGLTPKISTENSGVVLAVHGEMKNGIIHEAQLVASGFWIWPFKAKLPLEGVKMQDHIIFERLYSFCERYSLEKLRREGPSASQLSLVIFGLLKEGFAQLLGR